MLRRKIIAWAVHMYTLSGGILGVFALLLVAQGEVRIAFLLLVLTMIIDATDGIMARRANVTVILPEFSGARLDDAIDVLTFGWVPILIMGTENLLPSPYWIAIPTIALLYAYGQTHMKTDDAFFLGFPSYWNIVALYLWWLRPDVITSALLVVIPAILTFIPTRYLYPSKNYILWKTSWILGAVWVLMIIFMLLVPPADPTLVMLSLAYPAFYMGASFYIESLIRRGKSLRSLEE
jgi:phosphatidylcholine synthase